MTSADVQRAKILIDALVASREWQETFAEASGDEHALVEISDVNMTSIRSASPADSRALHGFEGGVTLPREDAIAWMKLLESYTTAELRKLGVEVQ